MSSTYDPSRDQNSLGGPTGDTLPGMGGGLDGGGGGLDGGGRSVPGAGPLMAGTQTLGMRDTSNVQNAPHVSSDPVAAGPMPEIAPPSLAPHVSADPVAAGPTPEIAPPSSAPAISPKVLPNPATTPDALPYAPANATKGFDGGDFGTPAGAPAAGGPMSKVGLDGGASVAGPGQFFAEGGEVGDNTQDDGADPQGAMGNDPYTQLISAAMESVDKTFEYGRQKNGLGQQGKQQGQQASQGSDAPKPPSAEPDSDGDGDTPGSGASDGDQDDEGAA